MSRYVTLGGSRLGAGNRMKQRLPEHSRSTHNLTHTFATSMAPGTLVPCLTQLVLPNDTWKIKVSSLILTKPTYGPMFGTFKFEVHVFYAPFRLYNGALHNNALGIGLEMQNVKFAQIRFNTTYVAQEVLKNHENPDDKYFSKSSLNAYMGYGTLPFAGTQGHAKDGYIYKFATHYLMYADIFKNAYANKQEKLAYVMGSRQLKAKVAKATLNESKAGATEIFREGEKEATVTALNPIYMGCWNVPNGENIFSYADSTIRQKIMLRGTNLSDEIVINFYRRNPTPTNPESAWGNQVAKMGSFKIKEIAVPGTIVFNEQNNMTFEISLQSLSAPANDTTTVSVGNGWVNGLFVVRKAYREGSMYAAWVFMSINQETLLEEYEPSIESFPLKNIDLMRKQILSNNEGLSLTIKPTAENKAGGNTVDYLPLSINTTMHESTDSYNKTYLSKTPLTGLLLKTYQADIFNAYLSNDYLEEAEAKWGKRISVSTIGDSFYIDSLLLAEKYFNIYNNIMIQGGTYKDWRKAMWSVEDVGNIETPMFIGGMSTEIYFQEINAMAGSEQRALGSIAGRGTSGQKKGGYITLKPKEEGLLMAITSITPRISYTQGHPWFSDLTNMQELHTPELDGIGFEALLQSQQAGWAQIDSVNGIAWQNPTTGKVPAWIWYQTEYDKVYGDLAESNKQNYMVLTRNYKATGLMGTTGIAGTIIDDNTTYIDPSKYNNCFAEASLTAQNFWVQIKFEIEARREMSANLIPRA